MLVANFVHLGGNLPKHLILNLKRFKKIFPGIPISLVVDKNCELLQAIQDICEVYIYDEMSCEHSELLSKLDFDKAFRQGFWFKTLERIFAFIEFHKATEVDTQLLHIESDVLLLPNFPWTKLQDIALPSLGWCSFSPDHDVASLLYSQNRNSSELLERKLIQLLTQDSKLTDMQVLNRIARNCPDDTFYFPMVIETMLENYELKSTSKQTFIDPKSRFLTEFTGVFDGAALGIYLTGSDPRNTFGWRLIHNDSILLKSQSYFTPHLWHYSMDMDGNVSLQIGTQVIPIYSLHIHSKNLRLFNETWEFELNRLINLPKWKKHDGFSLRLFSVLIFENYQNGSLFRFLFNPLRKKVSQWFNYRRLILKKRYPFHE